MELVRPTETNGLCFSTVCEKVPLWSSELDIFLFTADIPAVLSALTLVRVVLGFFEV
jgi:hypothetical protein